MRIVALLALFITTAATSYTMAATTYTTDEAKSTLGFTAQQSGADFDGKFPKFHASIIFADADLTGSRFDVEVDTKSVETGDADRDTALRGEDLFATEKYPQAHFVTSSFTRKRAGEYEAVGKLTVRGVTKEVRVPFTFKTAKEAGQQVAWLKGEAPLKRLDFDVGQGDWQDTSVVANEVTVKFALRLLPATTPSARKPNPPPARTTT